MNMQNVKDLSITEGDVRTIHDSSGNLLWGRLAYDTKYAGNTFQQTYSGKNLAVNAYQAPVTSGGVTFTTNADGSISTSGIATTGVNFWLSGSESGYNIEAGTYTLSSGTTDDSDSTFFIQVDNGLSVNWGTREGANRTVTVPAGGTGINIRIVVRSGVNMNGKIFKVQIESGSTATSYEPYVGGTASPNPDYPQAIQVVTGTQTVTVSDGVNSHDYTVALGQLELAKIGTYQDYIYPSGGDWYVHKACGKVVLDGTNATFLSPGVGEFLCSYVQNGSPFYNVIAAGAPSYQSVCNNFTVNPDGSTWVGKGKCGFNYIGAFWCIHTDVNVSTVEQFNDWLISNNTILYIPLNTPTDTQITDSTLIGQLDAIHEWLTRYGYNSVVSGTLPLIIDQTNLS